MKGYNCFVGLVFLLLSVACAAQKQKNTSKTSYKEDISSVRPSWVQPSPSATTNPNTNKTIVPSSRTDDSIALHQKLDSMYHQKTVQEVSGYRILIYSGTSSEEASKVRKQVYVFNPELSVHTDFKQPTFRVKVGNYVDKVQANYYLMELRKQFPNAMVVPDIIVPGK
ncbi:MAG: SPOR domain-containing protein [Cytophagaceae bacterium]|jgi:hypothetical protein|nr:SPOR domain-containing protein [Cytophagaceae bacterium]